MVKLLPGGPIPPQTSPASGRSNAARAEQACEAPPTASSGAAPAAAEPAAPSGFPKVLYSPRDRWLNALAQCLTDDGRAAPGAWSAALSLLRSVPVRCGDASAAQSDLTSFVNTALKANGALSLKAVGGEGQKGLSGAPVMLVRAPSGKPVAVAKVFTGGTDEFVAELSALERLAAVRPDMAVRALAAARTELAPGREAGVLVMSLAEGCPFDDLMLAVRDAQKGAPQRLKTALEGLGGVLVELHTAEPAERAPEHSVRRHAVALEQILEKCKPHGDLRREQFGFDLPRVAERAGGLTQQYLRDPGPVGLKDPLISRRVVAFAR